MGSCLHSAGASNLQAPQGQQANLPRVGGSAWSSWGAAAQLCRVAFGDAAQVPLPTFLGTGTQVFTCHLLVWVCCHLIRQLTCGQTETPGRSLQPPG